MVAPVADAARLAAVCVLARLDVDLAPLGGRGCLVVPAAAGPSAQVLARGLSRTLGAAPVLLLRTEVAATGGQLRAEQWVRGARQDGAGVERSPGLLLSGLPDDVERVLHGRVAVPDLPGATTSVGLGRLEAARAVSGGRPGPSARLVVPALLALVGLVVLLVGLVQLLSGGGSALVPAVGLLGVVLAVGAVLRRRAALPAAAPDPEDADPEDADPEDPDRAGGSEDPGRDGPS